MEDRTLTLTLDDGSEVECNILFTYQNEETNKNYVVFQVRGRNDVSAAIYHPTEGGNGSLERIETDEEWELLEDLLDDYSASLDDEESSCSGCQGCSGGCDSCDGCNEN